MSQRPAERLPACCPYLFYDDVEGAVRFAIAAFGMTERFLDRNEHGEVSHAQVAYGSAVVMLGKTSAHTGQRPRKSPTSSGYLNAGVYLFVDDVEAHARSARQAGATILMEPANMHWGDRLYTAEDPEGQLWMFASPGTSLP